MSHLNINSALTKHSVKKRVIKSETQLHICPKCRLQYNFFERSNLYYGKVPLILHCNHTMCEECIQSCVQKDTSVVCSECSQSSLINKKETLQEIFPVNFYLLGMFSYLSPNTKACSQLKLKPAGVSFSQLTKSQHGSSVSVNDPQNSLDSLLQEKCCKESCKQPATLRCIDCDEVYCEPCCLTLHNSARGLKKHKIISSTDFVPQLTESCNKHMDNSLEFYCQTCEKSACCYCITQDHNGHDFYQFSNTNIIDPEKFDTLIESAGEKLKRLILVHKKVKNILSVTDGNCEISQVDASVGKYFANLHAKLQILEKKVRKDAEIIKKKHTDSLNEMDDDLTSNIRTLNGLINTAINITNPNNKTKLNVKVLIERLENSLALPCYLIGDQQSLDNMEIACPDPFENIESIALNFKQNDEYRLVTEEELPENYDLVLPNELSLMEISDFNRSVTKSCESISSQSSIPYSHSSTSNIQKSLDFASKSTVVEGWVKDLQDANTSRAIQKLKPDDRESVMVSHIDTPESFYVQLGRLDNLLQNLFTEIQLYIKNFAPYVKVPEINKLYIVQYCHKNTGPKWFRARVINIETRKAGCEYTVFFIDYGNTSILTNTNKFREINTELAQLEPFAQKCRLFDLYPNTPPWDTKATMHMAQIITGTDVVMVVMAHNKGILEVDLLSVSSSETVSIRDALIFVGLALPYCSSSDSQNSIKVKSTKRTVKLHTRSTNFKNGEEFTVYISHILNCHTVYVQMADHMHHVDHLNSAMTNFYSKKSDKGKVFGMVRGENIYVPKKGMVIAIFVSNMWYRAKINKVIKGEGSVVAFLVDYGRTVTAHYTQIRKLPERYCILECQAILVKLSHVKPLNGNIEEDEKTQNYLQEYIDKQTKLRLVIVNDEFTPSVALFELFGTVESSINKNLIQEGLAMPSGDISDLIQYSKLYSKPSEPEQTYVFDLINTIQCVKKNQSDESSDSEEENVIRKQVNVILCNNPDEVFVEVDDPVLLKMHQELHSALQEYYCNKPKKDVKNWQINDSCVSYDFTNNQFFRGIIIDKVDNKFKVSLRDVAKEIVVNSEDLFVLHSQFKQFREKAVRCHLASIVPAGDKSKWSGLAIEFLQNIFERHQNVLMTKNGTLDRNRKSLPVTMWYSELKPGGALEPARTVLCNINKLLIKNGLALKKIDGVNNSIESTSFTPIVSAGSPKMNQNSEANSNILTNTPKTTKLNESNLEQFPEKSVPMDIKNSPIENNELFFAPLNNFSSNNNVSNTPKKSTETTDWNQIMYEEAMLPQTETCIVGDNKQSDWLETRIVVDNEQSDWLPSIPFKSKNFHAIVTFVDDNACIYAHEDILEPVLKNMEDEMNKYFCTTCPEPIGTVWVPGQLCSVKYFVTENWYRGKVVSVNDDCIKVFLIDYGNEEECRHEDLRFAIMYLSIPAFANKLLLYQVYPKAGSNWLTSDLDELHKMLVENKVHVSIKKNFKTDLPFQAIIKLGKININQYMRDYSRNLVMSPKTESVTEDENDSDVIIEAEQSDVMDSSLDENISTDVVSFNQVCLPDSIVGQKINVTVTTIINYNEVILEILHNCDIEETRQLFESISKDIKCKGVRQPQLYDLKVGQACIAKFSEDGEWYRGEVLNLDNLDESEVHIWFVDFGNSENVPKGCVKSVDPHWLTLPVLQYKAKIEGIKLGDPSCLNLVLECMSEYCTTNKLAEIISVNPLLVKLYNTENELSYQDLINQNLLVKTNLD